MSDNNHPIINLLNMSISMIPRQTIENNALNQSFNDQGEPKENPTNKKFINSLKTIKVDDITIDKKCCICQDSFKKGDVILKLPCNDKPHYFHKGESEGCDGILPWLYKNNNCPICRTEFPREDENESNEPSDNSEESNHNPNENIQPSDEINSIRRIPINNLINFSNIFNIVDEINESYQLETAIERSLREQ